VLAGLDRPIFPQKGHSVGTGLDLSRVSETRRYARLYRLSVGLYWRRAVQARLYKG